MSIKGLNLWAYPCYFLSVPPEQVFLVSLEDITFVQHTNSEDALMLSIDDQFKGESTWGITKNWQVNSFSFLIQKRDFKISRFSASGPIFYENWPHFAFPEMGYVSGMFGF